MKKEHKISDIELEKLASEKFDGETPDATTRTIKEIWKDGYRAAEAKNIKNIWTLQKVIKGYAHTISAMYLGK